MRIHVNVTMSEWLKSTFIIYAYAKVSHCIPCTLILTFVAVLQLDMRFVIRSYGFVLLRLHVSKHIYYIRWVHKDGYKGERIMKDSARGKMKRLK